MRIFGNPLTVFVALHAFLGGLFVFFLPVFLWQAGFTWPIINMFIALGGLGFGIGIWIWDRLRITHNWFKIMSYSFVLEILLLTGIFQIKISFIWALLSLIYGLYSSFLWMTQRALFLEKTGKKNTGQAFGNLQILTFIGIKAGVFVGGILLEYYGFLSLYSLAFLIALIGIYILYAKHANLKIKGLEALAPLEISDVIKFKDVFGSRFIFIIEAPLLFMETYFWGLTLFWITQENFFFFGLLAVGLGLSFGILFWIIKNIIDQLPLQKIFVVSIILYSTSWLGRAFIEQINTPILLAISLISITFCTSFFRLSFNKRLFNHAQQSIGPRYLIIKSYWTQTSIFFFFSLLALTWYPLHITPTKIYLAGALLAFGYGLYKPPHPQYPIIDKK